VLLGAAALSLVALVSWPHLQALLDRKLPPRVAARAIAESLRKFADTVGPVETSGAELRLFKGTLRLVVSEPRDSVAREAMGHFHVLATLADTPSASLDACLIGVGDSPDQRLESAVHAFVGVAFPPVLSRFKGEPMLGAHLFWGDEPWGVPGMHGYAGTVLARGAVDMASALEAPLFSGVPNLPRDGKLHLIKVVLYSKDGFWRRTVELDGHETGVSERRFAALHADAEPGMIVRYALFDKPATAAAADARERALERLKAREAWLFTPEGCPADRIPAALPDFSFSPTTCRGGRLSDCLIECERGAASFCYHAAQEVLPAEVDPAAAQALFLRSCRLGYPSGCTNAAAGRAREGGSMDECSVRTFDQICERSGDAWACTMLGGALFRGLGTSADPIRARKVLAKACLADQDDPACQAAKGVLAALDAFTTPAARP
jgi:hypothetical protein